MSVAAHRRATSTSQRPIDEDPFPRPGEEVGLRVPPDWQVLVFERFGPFYTRIVYLLPDGSHRTWTSRRHRLGLPLRTPSRRVQRTAQNLRPLHAKWLPARLSWWMAAGYLVGCVVFLIGLVLLLLSTVTQTGAYWWYLAAAAVFTAANYCGLVSALNSRDDLHDDPLGVRSYRWWGWRSDRIGYLISFSFVCASLLFLLRAADQLWLAPHWPKASFAATVATIVGSVIFLAATGVEVREVRIRRICWEPGNLAWLRAALSFLGCAGFVLGAALSSASEWLPTALGSTGSNVAFLVGIGLFLLGSYLILPELAQE